MVVVGGRSGGGGGVDMILYGAQAQNKTYQQRCSRGAREQKGEQPKAPKENVSVDHTRERLTPISHQEEKALLHNNMELSLVVDTTQPAFAGYMHVPQNQPYSNRGGTI